MPLESDTSIFNPLVHGTNSSIFAMLPHTAMKITSTINMLHKYKMAPLAGEVGDSLYGGGLGLDAHTYISFGRMNSTEHYEYGLERVIRSYAKMKLASSEESLRNFQERSEFSPRVGCEDINTVLVHLSRAKLQGTSLSPEDQAKTEKAINGVIQYHYFILLFIKYVSFDYERFRAHLSQDIEYLNQYKEKMKILEDPNLAHLKYENYKETMEVAGIEDMVSYEQFLEKQKKYIKGMLDNFIWEKFKSGFKYKDILKNITESSIDTKEIYKNPTEKNLQKILTFLEFQQTREQFFNVSVTQNQIEKPSNVDKREMFEFYASPKEYTLYNFIYKRSCQKEPMDIEIFEEITLSRAKALENKLMLFNEIIKENSITFSSSEQQFLTDLFPVILICNAEDKVRLIDTEYRANEDLTLGVDITMIATDTIEHQKTVMDFLAENNIHNVSVVLIAQLEQSQQDAKRPVSNLQTAPLPGSISGLSKRI